MGCCSFGLVPVWLFWSVTPVLLVPDGARGMRHLAFAGLAGVVVDGSVIPLGSRLLFPSLLHDWDGFGPIGVAMSLLIWCGVVGAGWVVDRLCRRRAVGTDAPTAMVVESDRRGQSQHPQGGSP